MTGTASDHAPRRWLVLIHQLPAQPASLRMKVWRRLQGIGAVAVKNAMYVLPLNDDCREDLAWVLREITAGGAEGAILEASFVDGMDDPLVCNQFDTARAADYTALLEVIRDGVEPRPEQPGADDWIRNARQQLARARKRLAEIEAIDFFGANGREQVAARLAELSAHIDAATGAETSTAVSKPGRDRADLTRRTWVTRRNVHVDRIASAWLIRRWIDPDAVFRFSAGKTHLPVGNEIRFDMFEAEFTHVGERCTFEVLIDLADPADPALRRIGEIVHDIDLKDGKYRHEETAGIASLVAGIVAGTNDDDIRIARGAAMLDDLYNACRVVKK